jgi:chemotaxis protein CheC
MATDAIRELVNIGIGHAAAALADLVEQPIEIDIPDVELTDDGVGQLDTLSADERYAMISQEYQGHISGTAMLVFCCPSARELVAMLLEEDEEEVLETETRTTLMEVGNILINSMVGMMVTAVGQEVAISLPVYVSGTPSKLRSGVQPDHHAGISVTVKFGIRGHKVAGRFLLVSTPEAMQRLLTELGVEGHGDL